MYTTDDNNYTIQSCRYWVPNFKCRLITMDVLTRTLVQATCNCNNAKVRQDRW